MSKHNVFTCSLTSLTMLIPKEVIGKFLKEKGIAIRGVLHIGAHECEERSVYHFLGISDNNVVWVDALGDKVAQAVARGIPNVYQAVISDKDGDTVTFYRTNNDQSSSILEFGTHSRHYPWCVVTGTSTEQTTTIDTLMTQKNLDPSNYDFWNMDIQGAELKALIGGENSLKHVKALYLEINTEEVYRGCAQLPELDAYLSLRGFRRTELSHVVKEGWGDALYIRI